MTTSNALDYRLDTFGIFPQDIARLPQVSQKVRRHAPKALDKLYAMIAADPEMMAMFGSASGVASARSRQGEHWNQVFSSRLQPSEMASSNRIGLTHARIGLEPKRYIGGYSILISELITSILQRSPLGLVDGGRTAATITTLVKVALLDMSVAISAYFEAEEQERNNVIAQLADALAALSNGEFVNELGRLPASFARIHQDFEAMRQHIDGALSEVSVTASSLGSGAAEIRQASDDLARRTEQQAASLEETAAALNRITGDVREAATGAGEARKAMTQADLEAADGGAILRDAVQAMGDIQSSAQQIGNIVEVIDGIAFQTNLLALNAGVEAARAGESGKGFAVVANEVRALAQRSADAANDIKALIRASSSHVERGVALVGQSGEAFARIAGKVGEIGGLVTAIADASERQAQGLHLVNSAVHDMDLTTQQNAAMVEQTNAAAHSLDGQASRLTELVGQFTLSGAVSAISTASRVVPMRPVARAASASPKHSAPALRTGTSGGDSWAEF